MGDWLQALPTHLNTARIVGARAYNRVQNTVGQLVPLTFAGGDGASRRRQLAELLVRHREEVTGSWWTSQFDAGRLRRYGIPVEELQPRPALLQGFLGPLFELLLAWLRTGEARFADVYLDERLRYAPHQASWALRTQFFDEVLPSDERALLGLVRDAALRSTLSSLLETLHAPLRAPAPERPLRVLAMGDCLMNEVRVSLFSRCRAEGLSLDFRGLYFSALYGSGLSADQAQKLLREFPADVIALTFLSYKGIAPFAALMAEADRLSRAEVQPRVDAILAMMRDFLALLRARTDAPFLVHNASGLPLSRARRFMTMLPPLSEAHVAVLEVLNAGVADLVAHTPNAILLDEASIAARHGLRSCSEHLIPLSVSAGAEFHTARFGEYLAPAYADVLKSYRELSRCKVLAVDFDNTLWDGVMADGAVAQRHDLQRLLRRLKDAGILLVAVSKNDPKNIRWNELTLEPGDFVLQKVSWDLKAASLRQAAHELDLGIDSFVLLDDNPAERELVRSQLPEVRALDPNAPYAMAWLERMLSFPNTRETDEARRRTELYREGLARKAALAPQLDYPTMMKGLELRARVGPARKDELDRIAELVQRTNQFNTTTIRYTKQQLLELSRSPAHRIYSAALSDRFGDVGLVAVAIVRREAGRRVIESFVMSCRAMGFGLEQLVLRRVLDAEGRPGTAFVGRYVATDRNTPCSGLYEAGGFGRSGETDWILPPDAPRPDAPGWFAAA
jgi:FkbH-like protein